MDTTASAGKGNGTAGAVVLFIGFAALSGAFKTQAGSGRWVLLIGSGLILAFGFALVRAWLKDRPPQ